MVAMQPVTRPGSEGGAYQLEELAGWPVALDVGQPLWATYVINRLTVIRAGAFSKFVRAEAAVVPEVKDVGTAPMTAASAINRRWQRQ